MQTILAHATGGGHVHPEEIIVIIGLAIAALIAQAVLARRGK